MSVIYDHHVIGFRARYSDGGKQNEMANATQIEGMRNWLKQMGHSPYIPIVLMHEHSAYDPNAYKLDEDLAAIRRYNRNNASPMTLLLHWDWTRWIRNQDEGNHWMYLFKQEGVEINTASNWLDFRDPNQKLFLQFEQHRAEQYSNRISQDTIKSNKGWKESGYYPHIMPRYFTRENPGTPQRRNAWLPIRENLSRAIDLILAGSTLEHARQSTGGREVHGSRQAFSDVLKNELLMARKGIYKFNWPPITDEFKWQDLQNLLSENRVFSKDEKALQEAFMCGLLVTDPCNKRASRSTTRRNGKVSGKYYICSCKEDEKTARHYRVHRDPVNEDALELLRSLALTANRQVELSKKAEARSKKHLANLKRDQARLKKKHRECLEIELAAKKKYVLDEITKQDYKDFLDETLVVKARLDETTSHIEHHGKILEAVKESISNIGHFLFEYDNRLQIRDFLMMLFPDGLKYDEKKRQFRTTSINAAYCVIGSESVSCSKISYGAAISEMTAPVVGGRPALVRTPQSDLSAFRNYLAKYA